MSFILKSSKEDLTGASIVKVIDKENLRIHYSGEAGELNGCCYIEFKETEKSLIILASPCPYNA